MLNPQVWFDIKCKYRTVCSGNSKVHVHRFNYDLSSLRGIYKVLFGNVCSTGKYRTGNDGNTKIHALSLMLLISWSSGLMSLTLALCVNIGLTIVIIRYMALSLIECLLLSMFSLVCYLLLSLSLCVNIGLTIVIIRYMTLSLIACMNLLLHLHLM